MKNAGYSDKGKLNVEVKFAPFACERRRAPMRVSHSALVVGIVADDKEYETNRTPRIDC